MMPSRLERIDDCMFNSLNLGEQAGAVGGGRFTAISTDTPTHIGLFTDFSDITRD
jgi:hypothetical protein